jgi:hypothetical protein
MRKLNKMTIMKTKNNNNDSYIAVHKEKMCCIHNR